MLRQHGAPVREGCLAPLAERLAVEQHAPLANDRSPASAPNSVLLPAPLGPITARNSPGASVSDMSSIRTLAPTLTSMDSG